MLRLLPTLVLLVGCGQLFAPRIEPTPPITVDPCTDPATWYYDADGDGFGGTSETWRSCARPSYLWVANADDCDDDDGGTFPGAIEECDGVDRDCNGVVDDATDTAPRWYPDEDDDGYANLRREPVFRCTRPGGYVAPGEHDCDDTDPDVHPNAEDPPCDGINQSCLPGIDDEVARVGDQVFHDVGAALARSGGTLVQVCPGVHDIEPVLSASGLRVIGLGGTADEVTLRGDGGRLFDVTAGDEVWLQGLTLERGDARASEADDGSGGALRAVAGTVRLRDVILRDHRADGDGGALYVVADALYLERVQARDTHAGGSGGLLAARISGERAELLRVDALRASAGLNGGTLDLHMLGADTVLDVDVLDVAASTAGGDGGAVHVQTAAAESTLDNVQLADSRAGRDGGALAVRGTATHRVSMRDVRFLRGQAERGGLIHARAAGELELRFRTSIVRDGSARSGGLVHVDSLGDIVDVDMSGSEFTHGAAEEGGLFHVVSQDQGDFYCNTATLGHSTAARGAGLLFTGRLTDDTEVDMDTCPITDTSGAPALEVDAEIEGTVLVELVAPGTRLVRNRDGGLSAPAGVTLRLRGIDVGTGSDENGGFDLRSGTTEWDGTGTDARVTCYLGVCTE